VLLAFFIGAVTGDVATALNNGRLCQKALHSAIALLLLHLQELCLT
jgi:hypothetical protein